MQENLTSSNDMLRELLRDKRRPDSNSETGVICSKRSKRDSNESGFPEKASEKAKSRASGKVKEKASEKAKTGTSQEVENDASDEANNSAGLAEAAVAQIVTDDDTISLFGYESSNSNEDEDEIIMMPYWLKSKSHLTPQKKRENWQFPEWTLGSGGNFLFLKKCDIKISVLQDTLLKVSSALTITTDG